MRALYRFAGGQRRPFWGFPCLFFSPFFVFFFFAFLINLAARALPNSHRKILLTSNTCTCNKETSMRFHKAQDPSFQDR